MRKLLSVFLASLFLLIACQKSDAPTDELTAENEIGFRKCAADEVLQEQNAADPLLRQRRSEIEAFISRAISTESVAARGTITIPVVVNVLWRTDAEKLPLARIQSQIDVLNEDFTLTNGDRIKVSGSYAEFADDTATFDIKFVLATENVFWKQTKKNSWTTNDDMKKSSRGGIDPTDPTTKLNMWVCNLGRGLLGYAQFPGGDPATDGIVVLYSAFGSRDKYTVSGATWASNYDLGRTATHEIGHWLNLRHIWGDATCGNDQVTDTPPHKSSNSGCPLTKPLTCTNQSWNGNTIEMTINYMDYPYDRCMFMFSRGQKTRSDAILQQGVNGSRYPYILQ
jgi:hypothetical protein